jgi:SAM-dependent methyltransferase
VSENEAPKGNAEYQWSQFDSEYYFQHYYGDPHPDDDLVIQVAAAALRKAEPLGEKLDIVDVGTGPNLIPFFCAFPRAKRLTAWEYAESNVAWLKKDLAGDALRPQWRHFWDVARKAHGLDLPDSPLPALRAIADVRQGSIFDLPRATWDAATMFFCAESITERHDEFETACAAFARCVKPGGLLVAAFLVRSGGYVIADRAFPVLHLSSESIAATFNKHADDVSAEHIGIVEREIRSGYAGFVLMTGKSNGK